MKAWLAAGMAAVLMCGSVVRAADQVWYDDGPSGLWSLSDLNWDAGAAAWTDGNNAVFAGGGETVDVSGAVSVANITFQTNGYTVADADSDGTLTLAGAPSVIEVQGAGNTGTVSEAIAGAGGFTKTGDGQLRLAAANSYAGTTTVSAGVLRLNPNTATVLGATGAGNEAVVAEGATLDVNSAYSGNVNQDFVISGAGVDGQGALVNRGPTPYYNVGYRHLTLTGNAVIGGTQRFDMSGAGTFTGNGYTLTKTGPFEMAVNRPVNGSPIIIRAGTYTVQNNDGLGGSTAGDTTLYGGRLQAWASRTVPERVHLYGGTLSANGTGTSVFRLTGDVTVYSNTVLRTDTSATNVLELAGPIDGPGGFTREGGGVVTVTGNANSYTGPTVVNGAFYLGQRDQASGVFGSGVITNNNNLYIDRAGAWVSSNGFFGGGMTAIRYGADLTLSASFSSNGVWHVAHGAFTLTNGATFCVFGEMTVANRQTVNYGTAPINGLLPTNVLATVTVTEGCELRPKSITFGNGPDLIGGVMTGILNHVGGLVRTTGAAAEENGIRLGHYPQTRSFYNMSGGTLIVGADWDLSCATDGEGWFNQTGGEVFAKRVMLNERLYDGGYGRLSIAGGVLNVGSLTGSDVAISNGIVSDPGSDYLVEFGGAGGTVRALTNVLVAVTNTLYGTGADAITFDTGAWGIEVSGRMTGPGGFNKTGSGVLTLSGDNAYAGPARILAGGLARGSAGALPAGGEVLVGVAADDSGGRLVSDGDLSLAGIVVGVANPADLDKSKSYTIATYGGTLTAGVEADSLPGPWYVYYDWANQRVQIKAAVGTLIRLR